MAQGISNDDGDMGFQIAPMVDVVFVLLLFFMAAAGSQMKSKELDTFLPGGKPLVSNEDFPVPIILDILPDGRVQANGKVYDSASNAELPELRSWLASTIAKFGDSSPVIIRPDGQARQQRIMDVLNAATAAGVNKVTFG